MNALYRVTQRPRVWTRAIHIRSQTRSFSYADVFKRSFLEGVAGMAAFTIMLPVVCAMAAGIIMTVGAIREKDAAMIAAGQREEE